MEIPNLINVLNWDKIKSGQKTLSQKGLLRPTPSPSLNLIYQSSPHSILYISFIRFITVQHFII